jgi:hypothetical protein
MTGIFTLTYPLPSRERKLEIPLFLKEGEFEFPLPRGERLGEGEDTRHSLTL